MRSTQSWRLPPSTLNVCTHPGGVWCLHVLQDEAQLIAADELCARGWWWHKKFRCWFIHAPNNPVVKNATARSERGTYLFFDTSIWDVVQVGVCAALLGCAGSCAPQHPRLYVA